MTPRRLGGVDAARGLALIGMMGTHLAPALVDGRLSWVHSLAAGRASAAFAVLAGAGLALATGGTEPLRGRARLAASAGIGVRAPAVVAIGLVLGLFDSGIAVILVYYGAFFLVALALLGLRWRAAAGVAGVAALLTPVLSHLLRPHLPAPDYGNPTPAAVLGEPLQVFWTITVTGYYPVLTWTCYLAAGVAVGRLPLRRGDVAWRLVAVGAALAVAARAGAAVALELGGSTALARSAVANGREDTIDAGAGLFGTTPTDTWWWLAVAVPHSGTPPDLLHTTGTAVLAVGIGLLIARHVPRLLAPVAAAGTMTLSWYTLHVVVVSADAARSSPYLSWGLQVAVVLVVSPLLVGRAGRRGPLEAVINRVAAPARRAVLAGR